MPVLSLSRTDRYRERESAPVPSARRSRIAAALLAVALLAGPALADRAEARNTDRWMAVPEKLRTWRPGPASDVYGAFQGPAFTATLVGVFGEVTPFTERFAVFRLRDGRFVSYSTHGFSAADMVVIEAFARTQPKAPIDRRNYVTDTPDFIAADVAKMRADGTLHTLETKHFTFWWGSDTAGTGKIVFEDPEYIARSASWAEKMWAATDFELGATMPYEKVEPGTVRKRINVFVSGTGLPWAKDEWAQACMEMWLHPGAMIYGSSTVAHELYHVVQCHTGGFGARQGQATTFEATADATSVLLGANFTFDAPSYLKKLEGGIAGAGGSPYAPWLFWAHLSDTPKVGRYYTAMWTQNRLDSERRSQEDPIQTLARIGRASGVFPKGLASVNAFFADYAARIPALDFMRRPSWAERLAPVIADAGVTFKETDEPRTWASPADRPLAPYGIHLVPLTPNAGARTITASVIPGTTSENPSWRYTLVDISSTGRATYSAQGVTDMKARGTVSIPVKSGHRYVLVVAATPTVYKPQTDVAWTIVYPYRLKLTGGTPKTGG